MARLFLYWRDGQLFGVHVIGAAADVTAALPGGRYLDSLRATDGAGTNMFWTGIILVGPNPWGP